MNRTATKLSTNATDLKPVDDTLAYLLSTAARPPKSEVLNISACSGRILATDLVAQINVPPADNSAMDGYAFDYAAVSERITQNKPLIVSQRIAAGSSAGPLTSGTLARIFTGAVIPPGADTVIMQENTEQKTDSISISIMPIKGANIRPAGQDLERGAYMLAKGTRIRSQEIGLMASAGIGQISVYRKLRVAVISTGSELKFPGTPLAAGQIYNSNHYTIMANIEALGMIPIDLGLIEDTEAATQRALTEAATSADCIISSGGVSVGEEDHVKAAVQSLGQLDLWKIAIKPGKPFAFGHVKNIPFLGLPGNPAAAFVTFMVFARPFLLSSQGAEPNKLTEVYGLAQFSVKAGRRREYRRVQLSHNDTGQNLVTDFYNQSSGVLSSLCWANGLALIEPGQDLNPGDPIKVQLLS